MAFARLLLGLLSMAAEQPGYLARLVLVPSNGMAVEIRRRQPRPPQAEVGTALTAAAPALLGS